MPSSLPRRCSALGLLVSTLLSIPCSLAHASDASGAELPNSLVDERVAVGRDGWSADLDIAGGEAVAISISLPQPSALPPNGRILASWSATGPSGAIGREDKLLHAFDPSVFITYGVPAGATLHIELAPLEEGRPFELRFATDDGAAPLSAPFPSRTPWPRDLEVEAAVRVEIRHQTMLDGRALLETEPNDGPASADDVPSPASDDDVSFVIFGGQDDADWLVPLGPGSGDRSDWFRIEHRGSRRKLLTANLQLVDPTVAGALHAWRLAAIRSAVGGDQRATEVHREPGKVTELTSEGTIVEALEHIDGRDQNERPHQQDDRYRHYITRFVEPGETYFIEVEANQPGYELELRLIDPAPYDDPERALRQGMYYHLAEVSAWMIHKPRGNALYRRLRDGTNLFGETCMSCHAQSGVWGVAEAQANGFPFPPGVRRSWSRLVDQMYSSARPTNTIEDASINTSTPPADYGDGLAGTRVLGRNMTRLETVRRPSLLRARQHLRVANFVLATTDPKAVNAAGRGANFGPNVVLKFAGEILRAAWDDTGDPRYLRSLEDKARDVLDPENEKRNNAVTDDLGHRIEFVHAVWPNDYLSSVESLVTDSRYLRPSERASADDLRARAVELDRRLREQAAKDIERLLALQRDDGSWAFELDGSGREGHPAPTAVSLLGLHAAGFTRSHPAVDRGIRYIVAKQEAQGFWRGGETGFVTTAYCLRALGKWLGNDGARTEPPRRAFVAATADETPLETILRLRRIDAEEDPRLADLVVPWTEHSSPELRAAALVALGSQRAKETVDVALRALGDPVKMVRDAASWSLRELLLDGEGWNRALSSFETSGDLAAEALVRALLVKAVPTDAGNRVDLERLGDLLVRAMADPRPAVRTAALVTLRSYWIWCVPLRDRIGDAWIARLGRVEPDALAETALRYSTRALLQANQFAGNTPFQGLDRIEHAIGDLRASLAGPARELLDRRLASSVATYYRRSGANNVHQLRYGSRSDFAPVIGESIASVIEDSLDRGDATWARIGIEAAAGVTWDATQARLIEALESDDIELAAVAARSLESPRGLEIDATPARAKRYRELVGRFLEEKLDVVESFTNFASRVRFRFEDVGEGANTDGESDERAFFAALTSLGEAESESDAKRTLDGADAIGRILGENESLRRRSLLDLVPASSASAAERHLWLRSLPWMLSFEDERETERGFRVDDAVEFETLERGDLEGGRIDRGLMLEGVASGGEAIWWREHRPGALVTFRLPVAREAELEVIVGLVTERDAAIVQVLVNGQEAGGPIDLFKPFVASTGGISLGVHKLSPNERDLTFTNIGASSQATKEVYAVGLDWVIVREPIDESLEAIGRNEQGRRVLDPLAAVRERLAAIYAASLSTEAPAPSRDLALRLALDTGVRSNPAVRSALERFAGTTTDSDTRRRLADVLRGDEERFEKDLRDAIAAERERGDRPARDEARDDDEIIARVRAFRDGPWRELGRLNPRDERSCLSCHGVPGRVPPLFIEPPEPSGRIAPERLLANYRKLTALIDRDNPDQSRVLLKPLNLQDEGEGSHQGGVRFEAGDAGFQILRDWVRNEADETTERPAGPDRSGTRL